MQLQGVPKNALSECCWTHSAAAQSPVANTPCVWKSILCTFLTKTKPNQALPSYEYGKIWPNSAQFWLWFFCISTFFWDTLYVANAIYKHMCLSLWIATSGNTHQTCTQIYDRIVVAMLAAWTSHPDGFPHNMPTWGLKPIFPKQKWAKILF